MCEVNPSPPQPEINGRLRYNIPRLCDNLVSELGFDWFLLFLSPEMHDASAAHALRTFCLALLTFGASGQKFSSEIDAAATDYPGPEAFRKDAFSGGWMRPGQRRSQMGTNTGLPFGEPSLGSIALHP